MALKIESLFSGKELEEFLALSDADKADLQAEFESGINSQLRPVGLVLGLGDRILDMLSASGLISKVAKLQREYYTALIDQGFTPDQALALASNFASFLSSVKKG